ncbi:MAG TPA: NIPSNAP family protein [Lacunisphaera sp.]|nr:NIPSNAP family protein [Lacunisphaera sp.]
MTALPTDRRDFLKSTLLATAAAAAGASAQAAGPGAAARDYYELRAYRLRPDTDRRVLDAYLEKALIPALHARGIAAVGVFTEPEAKDGPAVWVLIPHPSLESVAAVAASLNADPAMQSAAGDYFAATTKDHPAYERIDSWLLLAFSGLPRLAVPALRRQGAKRIFELRTYDSFNEVKALKKVEMFNAGEIELMQQLNLSPVFYGQALVGRDLPHLTYMLCSPDRETHKKSWEAFFAHPVWLKLKNDPQYADTVSKVTSRFLDPLPCSEI